MISADQVKRKQFATTRLREGYEMDEVDEFLHEIAKDLERRDSAQPSEVPSTGLQKLSQAGRVLELAEEHAEKVKAEAEADAQRIRDRAQSEVRQTMDEANAKRREMVGSLEDERANLVQEVNELRNLEQEARSGLRTYFLQMADRVDPKGAAQVPQAKHRGEVKSKTPQPTGERHSTSG